METLKTVTPSQTRLMSLDVMRGLDMFFLVALGPLLSAWQRAWGLPSWLSSQLNHVDWAGLTAWDLIMPWFIFMCGAAIPFALPKQMVEGKAGWRYWRHVLVRVVTLWVLGMVVQGNLLQLKWASLQFYNNTLQAIAAGYLIAALLYLVQNRTIRYLIPVGLAVGYTIALFVGGDYTPTGNLAIRVEHMIFPSNHDGYSWVLTSLMFGAMTACGMFCTEVLRLGKSAIRKMLTLACLGILLLVGGLIWEHWEPAIKRIYTLSFTAQALGYGVLMLTLLYIVIDVCHVKRGWGLITLYGQWALTAYLCGVLFWSPLNLVARILTQGLPNHYSSAVCSFVQTLVTVACLTGVLWIRKRLSRRS